MLSGADVEPCVDVNVEAVFHAVVGTVCRLPWILEQDAKHFYFFLLPRTATPAVVTPPAASWTLVHFSGSNGTFECLES